MSAVRLSDGGAGSGRQGDRKNKGGVGESKASMGCVDDVAFKAFTAGLGITTLYLIGTFSINFYRGLSWHSAQSKLEEEKSKE